jgi:hypothetical protein
MADLSTITLPDSNTYNFKDTVSRDAIRIIATNQSILFQLDTSSGGSATYEEFPYRGVYTNSGITSDMLPSVAYSLEQALSQTFAPVCESFNGGIYLYSTEGGTFVIPSISAQKGRQ